MPKVSNVTPSPDTWSQTLLKRVIVAVLFIPILVWIFWTGGYPLFVFLVIINAFGQWELYSMFSHRLRLPHRLTGFLAGLLIIMVVSFGFDEYVPAVIVIAFIVYSIVEILSGKENRLEAISLSLFSTVYPSLFIIFLIKISGLRYYPDLAFGRHVLLYVLIVIWTFDTMSYFAGRFWGKRPFFPTVSPKKTLEGFWGGVASVILLSVVAGQLAGNSYRLHAVVLSLLIIASAQAGDLAESLIKRDRGVKDSSRLIPGHGGILDRFDSLFFAGPVVYAYIVFFLHFES